MQMLNRTFFLMKSNTIQVIKRDHFAQLTGYSGGNTLIR